MQQETMAPAGVRQLIDKHKIGAGILAVILVVFAVWYSMRSLSSPTLKPATRWYFTVDRGRTWFADDITRIPPFLHDGKLAYRARIFTCDGKNAWCGYIERCNPQAKAQIDKEIAKGVPETNLILQTANNMEAEKPGGTDADWVPHSNPRAYEKVTTVTCPNNPSQYPVPVLP